MTQRIRTFMFWLAVLRTFRYNPFAAMVHFKKQSDYFLRYLQMTERELGYSIAPPTASGETPSQQHAQEQ